MPKTGKAKVSEDILGQVEALKSEGNKLFASKKYSDALEVFRKGIEALPEDANAERVDLICNCAACYMQMKQ